MEKQDTDVTYPMRDDLREKAESIHMRDYTYDLPDERIAQYPLSKRDSSKLLHYKNGDIEHHHFSDLPGLLPADSLLVFNDTRVIPARAFFQKPTGATIEILLLHPEAPSRVIQEAMLVRESCVWECMIGHKKRWKSQDVLSTEVVVKGQTIRLNAQFEDIDKNWVRFSWDEDVTFLSIVEALGEIPLPPYLNRKTEETDKISYQTVYAHENGAVAAPTAGLHFTNDIFDQLEQKGIGTAFLTLHVGAGTFLPIKVEQVQQHRMHSEQMVFSRKLIQSLLESSDHIVAVGTTSLRSLESLYWFGTKLWKGAISDFQIEKLYPYIHEESGLPNTHEALAAILNYMETNQLDTLIGQTEIFIFPGYRFRMCKGLVTNFHQPGSTLILLVAAFIGADWTKIYDQALENDYRFLSYGDSSLLWYDENNRDSTL